MNATITIIGFAAWFAASVAGLRGLSKWLVRWDI